MHRLALGCLCLVACGAEDGLPITGDITLGVGDDVVTPTVGAVIRDADPEKVLIVIGTRDISCQTNLQSPLRKGTYVTMVIDPVAGAQPEALVTVVRVGSSGTLFNGGPDAVMIDLVDDRIAGSVDFMTTDQTDEGDVVLTVSGTFDVENCLL